MLFRRKLLVGGLLLLLVAGTCTRPCGAAGRHRRKVGSHGAQVEVWEQILAGRLAVEGPRSASELGTRELQLWRTAMGHTMRQVLDVSWWLNWNKFMGTSTAQSRATTGISGPQGSGTAAGAAGGAQDSSASQEQRDTDPRVVHNPDLDGREPNMMHLVRCITDATPNASKPMTWQGAMSDQESSTVVVGAWWRNHAPGDVVTVVTSASVSRLPQLYAQCLSWPGPLSVVLYQALPASTDAADDATSHLSADNKAMLRTAALQISQFMLDMQQVQGACKPDVLLVYEMYSDEQARQLLYPFNLLRNLARLQARTPLVALLDVDLVLSRTLATRAANWDRMQWLKEQATLNKTVFIIPAFDVRGQHERAAWADALVSSSKEVMVFAFNKSIVVPFQLKTYPDGHRLTDHEAWKSAKGDYFVQHQFRCEPWFIGDRLGIPWHDARYRGYGLDKVQFVSDVAAHGYAFRVMHDVYTIHRAHKKATAREVFIQGGLAHRGFAKAETDKSLYMHNFNLFTQQEELKSKGQVWTPQLTAATRHCLRVLPWFGIHVRSEAPTATSSATSL